MLTTQYFGIKIQRYMHDHGITSASLARVAAKAFRNGERNPAAWRRKPLSDEDILASPMVADPLTQYMFCSPSAGAVALVVCHPGSGRPVPGAAGVRPGACPCARAGSAPSRCSAPACR